MAGGAQFKTSGFWWSRHCFQGWVPQCCHFGGEAWLGEGDALLRERRGPAWLSWRWWASRWGDLVCPGSRPAHREGACLPLKYAAVKLPGEKLCNNYKAEKKKKKIMERLQRCRQAGATPCRFIYQRDFLMTLLISVWWLLRPQDEMCGEYHLGARESASAELPCLAPDGTEAGSGSGVLEAVGQPAEQKRGFEGEGRGLFL